ncbi:MAG: glycosyltransferase [Azospirillaceae bacterium]
MSVVIPVLDEVDNVGPLAGEIGRALDATRFAGRYEIVFVDDGSTDGTAAALADLAAGPLPLRVLRHDRPHGQSAAIRAGVAAARGGWIVTLDGDGQNDPADIPALLDARDRAEGPVPGLVGGLRVDRHDSVSRKWASRLANGLRGRMLGDDCPDTGCGLKLFRRDVFLELPRFRAVHRFLPALFRIHGERTVYVPVGHRARRAGRSKYGNLKRGAVGVVDLLGVYWLARRGVVARAEEVEIDRADGLEDDAAE